jgi:hypothetical protein
MMSPVYETTSDESVLAGLILGGHGIPRLIVKDRRGAAQKKSKFCGNVNEWGRIIERGDPEKLDRRAGLIGTGLAPNDG